LSAFTKLWKHLKAFVAGGKCSECSKQIGASESCTECLKFKAHNQTYSF
jgi:hypothetical protein